MCCPLVPSAFRLIPASCSSAHDFASDFLPTPHCWYAVVSPWLTFGLVSLVKDFTPSSVSPFDVSPISCRTRPAHNVAVLARL